uniref:Fibrinogen C-terminal domain-containing protein n=1 Tax=Steinernema glaseri TaxID=37863 RepID=A0A1I7YZV2_9BILA
MQSMTQSRIMVSFRPHFLLLIVSTAWAAQRLPDGEDFGFGSTVNDRRTLYSMELDYPSLFPNESLDVSDDKHQNAMKIMKTIAEAVDTFVPIPMIKSVANMVAFCAKTEIDDKVSEKLKKIEQLLTDGFSNLERSLKNAVDTLRCDQAFSTYRLMHQDRAVRFMQHLHNLIRSGAKAAPYFRKACELADYATDLASLMNTLSYDSNFGMTCLADKKYSYTAMLEIKRIIKMDAFILSLNALNCQIALNRTYDLGIESTAANLKNVFTRLNETQDALAIQGLNNALPTFLQSRTFSSASEMTTAVLSKLKDYNNSWAEYMVDVVSRGADSNVVSAPGYDNRRLEFKEVGNYSVYLYGGNLTADSTRENRKRLTKNMNSLYESLDTRISEQMHCCPSATELANEIYQNYTMLPYVRVVIRPVKNDSYFYHYGDERIGRHLTFMGNFYTYPGSPFGGTHAPRFIHVLIGF